MSPIEVRMTKVKRKMFASLVAVAEDTMGSKKPLSMVPNLIYK